MVRNIRFGLGLADGPQDMRQTPQLRAQARQRRFIQRGQVR